MSKTNNDVADDVTALEEGKILDYATGRPVKENPKELVRQRLERALFHEYGISVDDMEPDFKLRVGNRQKKIDIGIFNPGSEHVVENLRRIVICQKEPVIRKGAFKMRDHKQAEREFELLHAAMAEAENCDYGLWTNGLEFFFFGREKTRFDIKYQPLGDWPMADETLGTRDVASNARLRRADPAMLRTAFRRCHNFIHGNEGMPKDAAFWQFLYLIFAKMHDEKKSGETRRFWASPTEQFDPEGRKAIRTRVEPLFDEVKEEYPSIFRGNEEITLSDRALAFMVSELAKYDFGRTDVDAKGAAYQEIVGTNLRGDRGQYFTPRGAIKLLVQMLDPKADERVLDPACGTGGFLVATLDHLNKKFHAEAEVPVGQESTEEFLSIQQQLIEFATKNLFGADFDQFLVRAAQMNVVMASNAQGNLFHMNSLEFPAGHLDGVEAANSNAPLGSIDVLMTNPPFGSDIPVTDPNILKQYELAHIWERTDDGAFRNTGRLQGSVAPEVLFIERCVGWVREGGRLGIVLPDGILGNPAQEYIRWWILRYNWLLASVDLPVEVFVVEANVNILTSLLLLKKKTQAEVQAEDLGNKEDYPVFMAVAEKVGFDRRGNTLYMRSPDGEEILEATEEVESIRVNGELVTRTLKRKSKIVDDDLPRIAEAYAEFRSENEVPGSMITRIEVTNYRCFDKLDVDLEDFRVLVGANGAGKTTLMDVPSLLGDLLQQSSIGAAFLQPLQSRGSRATSFNELIHQQKGQTFILAVEVRLPETAITKLLNGVSKTVKGNEALWPRFARYEIRLEVFNDRELQVQNEYLFLFSDKHSPVRDEREGGVRLYGEVSPHRSWMFVLKREYGSSAAIGAEVREPGKNRRPAARDSELPPDRLALAMVGFESRENFPASRWVLELLTTNAVFFDPSWSELRKASAPGQPAQLIGSGANLPWLALDIQKNHPNLFENWCDHIRIVLPQVTKIEVIERDEDHHAYFKLTYNDSYTVTSSGLSDGTLRILALMLLSNLPAPPKMLVLEEPENGIHPKAIEAVLQGLISMHDTQVLLSTHSPVVVANVPLGQLLVTRIDRFGAATVTPGSKHPRLVEWKGDIDLSTLFAAGVLG